MLSFKIYANGGVNPPSPVFPEVWKGKQTNGKGEKPMRNKNRFATVKSGSFLAAITLSMMMLASNANAFWLDIVKTLATGIIGAVKEQTQTKASVQKSAAPASNTASNAAPEPSTPATPESINAALDSLVAACKRISEKVPCAVGRGIGSNPGTALEDAHEDAIIKMAKSMGAYVKGNTEIIKKTLETDDDYQSSKEKITVENIAFEQEVKNTQMYLTHTHKVKKGSRELDEVFLVLVMDTALFERALTETSQGSPLSQQIINESTKSVATFIKDILKKKK
jgi:hypothetical protein